LGWFFPVSKAVGFASSPSHILMWLVLGVPVALMLGRTGLAHILGFAAAFMFVLLGVTPLGGLLARPIEARFPRAPLPEHITGIVTLGAGLGVPALVSRGAPGTSPSIDRLVSTYELARLHPEARVVFSGGWGADADAIAARADFLRLGLDPARLVLEGRSRNTYENLAFSQAMVHPRPGETWVLATSAIQLPRAMAVAQRVGWRMIPWPTDYRTDARPLWRSGGWFRIGDNLRLTDEAVHEWLGLAAYGAAGLSGKQAPPAAGS
jgi:uncharacterized SAM-binding protein YcdF (DUF218 family)